MEKIVLFDPSHRSLNKGDEIIMRSTEYQLQDITSGAFVVKSSTHMPAVTFYQNDFNSAETKIYKEAKYKFICGSNLLWRSLIGKKPSLNVNPFNLKPYYGSILMGVGLGGKKKHLDIYTKSIYQHIINDKFIHSVRDDETKIFLESMGFKAINTGCPTTWLFTNEFCRQIPKVKSSRVVFTLTDYCKNKSFDQKLIDILKGAYKEVFFWIQGANDYDYLNEFNNIDNIHIINPDVNEYDKYLNTTDTDYVGTRLHAGMFAMQHKKRSIIIAVDNRTKDMQKSYGLVTLNRESIDNLGSLIETPFETRFGIQEENILQWKSQFK